MTFSTPRRGAPSDPLSAESTLETVELLYNEETREEQMSACNEDSGHSGLLSEDDHSTSGMNDPKSESYPLPDGKSSGTKFKFSPDENK